MNTFARSFTRVISVTEARLRAALDRGGVVFVTAVAAIVAASLLASPQASAAGCGGCGPSDSGHAHSMAQADPHAGHGQAAVPPNASGAGKPAPMAVTSVLEQYSKIHAALATDTIDGARDAAQAIANLASGDAGIPPDVAKLAGTLAATNDLAAAREAFKALSSSLIRYLGTEKIQTGRLYGMYCSMANASWIQNDKTVKNPYYGKSMPTCGEVVGSY